MGPGPAQPKDQVLSCTAQNWRDLSSGPARSRSGAAPHRGPAQSQAQPQHGPTGDQQVTTGTDSTHSPRQGKVQSGAAGDRAGDKAAA